MKRRDVVPAVVLHAALAVLAVATLAPLLWMVSASFMSPGESNVFPPRLLPARPTLQNYVDLFTRLDLARYFLNSTLVAVSATLISLLVNSMAGYAFAKLRFRGRERVFQVLLAALVIPGQVGAFFFRLASNATCILSSFWGDLTTKDTKDTKVIVPLGLCV